MVDGGQHAPRSDHRMVAYVDGRGVDEGDVRVDEDVVPEKEVLPDDEAHGLEDVGVLAKSAEYRSEELVSLLFVFPSSVVDSIQLLSHFLALFEPAWVLQGECAPLVFHDHVPSLNVQYGATPIAFEP